MKLRIGVFTEKIARENVIMSSQFKPSAGYKEKVIESFNLELMRRIVEDIGVSDITVAYGITGVLE